MVQVIKKADLYTNHMVYDSNLFKSTAHYYTKYCPPYPLKLFTDIAGYFGLSDSGLGSGGLLDLGCGSGEMALPLAKYFGQVYAWDPDADMLIETRRNARAALTPRQLRKIVTAQKSSADLASATSRTFKAGRSGLRLVTMGQSFQWMDERAVLGQVSGLLRYETASASSRGVVIISGVSDVEQSALSDSRDEFIRRTVAEYLGPQRTGESSYTNNHQDGYRDLLLDAGFHDPREMSYEYVLPRNIDQTVGYVFSLSWASKHQLGNNAVAFETKLRAGLAAILAEAGADRFDDRVMFISQMAQLEVAPRRR